MDERFFCSCPKSSLSKNREKLFFVFFLILWTPISLTHCSSDESPSPQEPITEASQDAPPLGGAEAPSGSSPLLPPGGPTQALPSEEGFWDRSIDDVIASVNSPQTDQKLREDASLSRELETGKIPLEINAAVQKWLKIFTGRDRERFQRFLNRGEIYRPMIMAVLKDRGVPPELYFLAMIESGFAVHAKSHAQAVGVWQFIKPTGQRYGLRVNPLVDERRDPVRSTIAAALYLRDLNNVFQSWYLAMAAYNAGEGRILQAIMKANTRDFWEIARKGYLPAETMNYIPKFLAAAIIGHHLEKYGFTQPSSLGALRLTSAFVPSGRSLLALSEATSIPLNVLKSSNPHLLRAMIPHDRTAYRLWLPPEYIDKVESRELAKIPKSAQMAPERNELNTERNHASTSGIRWHRVRRGDTLEKIAMTYGMSTPALKQLNRLRSHRIIAGQKLKVLGSKSSANHEETFDNKSLSLEFNQPTGPVKYTVRPGDNLADVARRFGTSIVELKKLNRLRTHTIYAGQVLHVAPKG